VLSAEAGAEKEMKLATPASEKREDTEPSTGHERLHGGLPPDE
jgi:hypothetical protein